MKSGRRPTVGGNQLTDKFGQRIFSKGGGVLTRHPPADSKDICRNGLAAISEDGLDISVDRGGCIDKNPPGNSQVFLAQT